ncbi:MAG: hypothetical protein AAGF31_03500 [Planctomycetota bacterium]
MNGSDTTEPTFGYLDILEDAALGTTGGYLIVSATGRPLEFHCTAPVAPSRAQQILFGPTLRPHLLGEQIGATLVERAQISPSVILAVDADFVGVSDRQTPLLLVAGDQEAGDQDAPPRGDWKRLTECDQSVWHAQHDAQPIAEWLSLLSVSIDIAEPFERIREAIREAQRLGQEGTAERDAA